MLFTHTNTFNCSPRNNCFNIIISQGSRGEGSGRVGACVGTWVDTLVDSSNRANSPTLLLNKQPNMVILRELSITGSGMQ